MRQINAIPDWITYPGRSGGQVMIRAAFLALGLALSPLWPAAADLYTPLPFYRYDMRNGSGQASGGIYNYWDTNYTGTGSTMVDGAPLTGGNGKLGDGVIGFLPWYLSANTAGTGPDVGWLSSVTPFPSVTFYFPIPTCVCGRLLLTGVDIWLDNSLIGGVAAPLAILVNGVSVPFSSAFFPSEYGLVKLFNLNLVDDYTPTLTFVPRDPDYPWVFVSEVSFRGAYLVPEPATLGLFGLGLATLLAMRRRAGQPVRCNQAT